MDNFIYGLQSVVINLNHTILAILNNQIIWGFCIGFFGSTVIHLLMWVQRLDHLPHILTKEVNTAFLHVADKDANGVITTSYSKFQQDYYRIRSLGLIVTLALLIIFSIFFFHY